ncbi:AciT family ciprofloxacin tolerance protein [Psychrobacter pygoscelis]|uniref:AciT family ciprofloxacin tolerance protein n=1 Tax=Psychrobacter pygoscelis TaxID=2488563 RepID=UPI00103CC374|nr:AciT family ciprofloxacin tolerance protein [Psychrobacter pygoscelis]
MLIFTLTTLTSGDINAAPIGTSSLSSGELMGYGLLAIGVIATALSSQRYLLLYALAGMMYWLVIEGMQTVLTSTLPLSSWHGYVTAMAISWLPFCAWVIARIWRYDTVSLTTKKRRAAAQSRYIEHTPVYDQYQPKFQ